MGAERDQFRKTIERLVKTEGDFTIPRLGVVLGLKESGVRHHVQDLLATQEIVVVRQGKPLRFGLGPKWVPVGQAVPAPVNPPAPAAKPATRKAAPAPAAPPQPPPPHTPGLPDWVKHHLEVEKKRKGGLG